MADVREMSTVQLHSDAESDDATTSDDETGLTQGMGTEWNDHDTAWKYVQSSIKRNKELVFFDNLAIAMDGGLDEINGKKDGDEDHLWANSRYFGALLLLSFVGMNIFFIFKVDLETLNTPVPHDSNINSTEMAEKCGSQGQGGVCGNNYLLTGSVLRGFNHLLREAFGRSFDMAPEHIICGMELIIMCFILLLILFRLTQVVGNQFLGACCSCCANEQTIRKWERQRWFAASVLFWDLLPQVSVFSAMKLLFFITPQILALHLNSILFYQTEHQCRDLLWFVFSRGIACIVGFDSFLVKYRAASMFIMTNDFSLMNLLGAVMLLNQILGVVQVSWVIRERLFRYVFAGEDGVMSHPEKVRMDTWNALVAQRIFEKYNLCQRWALALTFNDDDFQRLTLHEIKDTTHEDETPETAV